MKYYFESPEAGQALRASVESWHRTPFAYYSRAKGLGGGIDCVGYIEEIMADAGLPRFQFARTEQVYSRHVHNDRILNYLRGRHADEQSAILAARFAEFPVADSDFTEPAMIGDLLILKEEGREGRGVFHMPVMIGRRKFTHCAPRLGVAEGNIEDPSYRKHLVAHFRARAEASTVRTVQA